PSSFRALTGSFSSLSSNPSVANTAMRACSNRLAMVCLFKDRALRSAGPLIQKQGIGRRQGKRRAEGGVARGGSGRVSREREARGRVSRAGLASGRNSRLG